MLNQLKINNIDNYEFFEAIKPEEKDIDEWNKLFCKKIDNVKTKEMAIKYKIGCLGCLKSHFGVIKDALKRGFETILILEDDTIFGPNYKYLPYYMRLLNSYSMLYLTGSHLGKQLKINNNIMRVEGTYTTGSYIIKKDAMEYFVNNIEGYTKEVDVFYAEEIQTRYKSYCTIPHLAKQMDGYSDIQCKKVLHHDFKKN
jgi:GR25 family glycosyltransferase involved in LPS biosynthesis